jgi:non-ribosomal peptide synthetase component F
VNEIPLITAGEQKVLLEDLNDTLEANQGCGRTLIDLFEDVVESAPGGTALAFDGTFLTYAELNARVNQLCRYLTEKGGVGHGDVVAVRTNRSQEMIIHLLAILKAGAAYLPIDIGDPPARANYMLLNAGVRLLIGDEHSDTTGIAPGVRVLIPSREAESIGNCAATNPTAKGHPQDVAYVIHTSGSTGEPKGVMIEHRGAVNRISWMWEKYGFSTVDVVLQKTSYIFDVSVWEIFMTLCYGAKLVLCDKDVVYDPIKIVDHIEKYGVTTLHFVPVMLNAFIDMLGFTDSRKVRTLRHVFTSGEA